jgi:catechol 2,3-dioxygenase
MPAIPPPVPPHPSPDDVPSPPRLPPETRPGPVRLQVADLSRSLAWYGDLLGMRVLDSGSGWARLGAHGEASVPAPGTPQGAEPLAPSDIRQNAQSQAPLAAHLVELVERPGAAPVPRRGHLGLYHVALLLPDRANLGRFVAHLAHGGIPAGSADHLVSEALYLRDPDGLGIEVYADRPRASWRHTPTGEVAMATDPLALDDLVRAGGGVPWRGLPSGTRVGHLHLQVGDLQAAEAFYARALGLEVQVRSYPGALFLSAGGYHHHLGVNTWARSAAPAAPDDARLLAWSLVLPHAGEVEIALRRMEASGHSVTRIAPEMGRISDPWGTVLELQALSG